jgi:hypothetical protein
MQAERAISESRLLKRRRSIHDETSIGRKYLILFRFRQLLTCGTCCQGGSKSALLDNEKAPSLGLPPKECKSSGQSCCERQV